MYFLLPKVDFWAFSKRGSVSYSESTRNDDVVSVKVIAAIFGSAKTMRIQTMLYGRYLKVLRLRCVGLYIQHVLVCVWLAQPISDLDYTRLILKQLEW